MAVVYSAPDTFLELMGDNSIDMDGDTFKIALLNAYTFDAAHDEWADVSAAELATGNGYTSPGQNLASVTWGQTGGTVVFDAANVTWTASGGSIGPSTDAEIYSDTSVNDKLVCNIDFGASESAGDGSNFQINFNASGIFTGAFS
jgi:hypothetical protein